MIYKNIGALTIGLFENLLKYKEIPHFVSTRDGGFSSPPYNSLNLSFNVGDNPKMY